MKHFFKLYIVLLFTIQLTAQTQEMNQYSYVVVPDKFEFLSSSDQYQLNSMTVFYLDKSGFNAYSSSKAPNAERCDGLYANVEKLSSLFGSKLQVVLHDCYNKEIYRSEIGMSKYKEYDKTYQDALRKAFASIERLRVNQKDVVLLNTTNVNTNLEEIRESAELVPTKSPISDGSEAILPTAKFLNYSNSGQSFLLRKTADGYSLYLETAQAQDGLQLMGKIIEMETLLKYLDTSGKVYDVVFEPSGNLVIMKLDTSIVYKLID